MNAIHSAISATPATGASRAATVLVAAMALAGVLAVPLTAFAAAGTDELWEMTMEMSAPGMPAGMGAQTTQQCQGKDWRSAPGAEECTISDLKETATRVTYKATCGNPPTTTSIDITFEQNRSRLKGTMRAVTPQGEMLTRMSGRRIGTCDAAQVRREQQAAVESSRDMQRQHQDLQRRQREIQLSMDAAQAAETQKCTDALSTMDAGGFGTGAYCHTRTDDETCRELSASDTTPTGATHRACSAKFAEFCRQFQTQAGFEKTKHGKDASELCGVPIEPLRAKFCPGALKTESIAVLDEHCPAEKKILAQQRCHGPDYSWSNFQEHLGRHKYYNLCTAYCMETKCSGRGSVRPAAQSSGQQKPPPSPDTSGEAINQGIKKLKGLFGR